MLFTSFRSKSIFLFFSLSHFLEEIANDEQNWKAFYTLADATEAKMPEPYGSNTNQLIKLIILKCLRPDALYSAVERFVGLFDETFIDIENINLKSAFECSTSKTPIIYFASTGIDATADILNLAYEINSGEK